MRLDKFLANNSTYSRSEIHKLIKSGRVFINSDTASSPSIKIKSNTDQIHIDKQLIEEVGLIYLMLNKPDGFICANTDANHPTVIDLLFEESNNNNKYNNNNNDQGISLNKLWLADLQIVGRLDIDTTGLVLVTNDGDWNHKVTSPNHHCTKRYLVELAEPVDESYHQELESGLLLTGEKKQTKPAKLEIISQTQCLLEISEGKYHQVKRMFAALGNRVTKLHREAVGEIELDTNLKEGQFRHLTPKEIESVK